MTWTVRVTDSLGRTLPKLSKQFKDQEQKAAIEYANQIYKTTGEHGKRQSIFIERK